VANPTQAEFDKLTVNLGRWDGIVNGGESETIDLDVFSVKTAAGYLNELRAYNDRGTWITATTYAVKDIAQEAGTWYVCLVAHTSGVFATDKDVNGYWAIMQIDFSSNVSLTGDFSVDGNTFHVDSLNNRVGIGTLSPDKPVHIEADTTFTSAILKLKQLGTGDCSIQMGTVATNWVFGVDNSDGDRFAFGIGANIESANRILTMVAGSVGIGPVNPGSIGTDITTLHIKGSAIGRTGGTILESSDSSLKMYIYGASSDSATDPFVIETRSNHGIRFGINSVDVMKIAQNGYLGIGQGVDPLTPLHVTQTSASGATPVAIFNQMDVSEPFTDYIGLEAPDAVSSISSLTTSGATSGHLQMRRNGGKIWVAFSTIDPT